MPTDLLAPRQIEFIRYATTKVNIAHGSVRSGKTVGSLFGFMHAVDRCPDSQIWMIGHTSDTIYNNAVRLLMESDHPSNALGIFRPYLSWHPGKRVLMYKDKKISTLGAKNEGSIGAIQGKTMSLSYNDEITLFPESIIDMINTRHSNPHSKLFGTCNPSHPGHKIKEWIDKAENGDPDYYQLHFTLDDNPYLDQSYKNRMKNSLSGLFYKRNYLGLWCLAEGAVFDFFDRDIHIVKKPPACAEYWVVGIDYGTSNSFACSLMGVNTGRHTQTGVMRWIEKEYVWNSKEKGRQKTNSEYADDVQEFIEPYAIKGVYVDPSAASFKLELQRRGIHVIDADNDVLPGLTYMTSEMAKGSLFICQECEVLIKEIEGYVWDSKASEKGEDAPLKKNDHMIDATRYAFYSHKVVEYKPYKHNPDQYQRNRFGRVF